jgi:hypothetical protein
VDQVAVLKLALRDTEAKLVAAEHRLRQVQQQLDDERRALAEATGATIEREEAVVDAAVAETVAEAVVAAELAAAAGSGTTDPTDLAAATLEEAAEVLDAVLADEAAPGRPLGGTGASHADAEARSDAEAAFTGAAGTLTPPLPEHGSDAEPNESWTLVHLRKEAERRGITGVSNLSKAALIERLRR